MPALSPSRLVNSVMSAIQESGYSSVLLSPVRNHPRKFAIQTAHGISTTIWVYIWTLTPGGRKSLPHEFRIQTTTVESPLQENPDGRTILIGYEPNLNLFAGFDLSRHRTFTTGSPSVQTDIRTVRQALQDGMSFDRKSNGEITIGFRPDQFFNYATNAFSLHKAGKQKKVFNLLERASSLEEITEQELDALSQDRQRLVQQVSRLSRKANFRQQVLYAYGNRCAITGAQLKLVDAAHILPVGAPGSIDIVMNGIALSPTYHRAYDNGLIYLNDQYEMKLNPGKATELTTNTLDGGLRGFCDPLGKIILPPDRQQWPEISFVNKSNRYRQISVK